MFTEYLIEEKKGGDRMMSRQIQSDLGSDSYILTITPKTACILLYERNHESEECDCGILVASRCQPSAGMPAPFLTGGSYNASFEDIDVA